MAASVALLLAMTIPGDEFSSCLQTIARQYLKNRCFSFQFPINYSEPSLVDVPSGLRSPLLKNLHQGWTVHLPAVSKYSLQYESLPLGPTCYLNCAYIIILKDDISYIEQIDEIIYNVSSQFYEDGGGNKTRIVITVSGETNKRRVYRLLRHMFKKGDIDVIFVGKMDGVINVFTLYPYGKERNSCPNDNTKVETLDRWVDGRFEKSTNLFPNKVPWNFQNCTINVGTMHDPPHFIIDEEGNVEGGIEYQILEMIGRHIGLRNRYKFFSGNDSVTWDNNARPSGIRTELRKGQIWVMVSGHSNYVFTFSCYTVAHTYLTNQISWFFRNPAQIPNWKLIFLTFDLRSWILVLVASIAFPLMLYLMARFLNKKHPFQRLSTSMMYMLGLLLSNPSHLNLKDFLFRTALAIWFFYIIHVNLAYSAGLTSLLTTGKQEPKITSFEQILDRNMKTAMTMFAVIQTSGVEDPLIRKVLDNRILVEDVIQIILHPELERFTLLEREPAIQYKIKKYDLSLYKSDLNLGFLYLGFKMRRNHFLIRRFAELSSRVLESGFIDKFVQDYWSVLKSSRKSESKSFTLRDLTGPFVILGMGSAISLAVFLWEICGANLNRKQPKLNNAFML